MLHALVRTFRDTFDEREGPAGFAFAVSGLNLRRLLTKSLGRTKDSTRKWIEAFQSG